MLRTIIPKDDDPIFSLHKLAEHIVCDIWYNADENDWLDKLKEEHKGIVNAYSWLKTGISTIYKHCRKLTDVERDQIKQAFYQNNDIEGLCDGNLPVYLNQLPSIVRTKMKPLFVKFYKELLERVKVEGDKLEYYKALYKTNRFKYCPCCGYMPFDTGELDRREAYDHYLPKSKYPFASVNFKNLVPLCYKCNSDRKKNKDPIESRRKAFYPFRKKPINLEISTNLSDGFVLSLYEFIVNDLDELDTEPPQIKDVKIKIVSDEQEQADTWDELFAIKNRFSERTGQFSYSVLRKLSRRFRKRHSQENEWSFTQTLDEYIQDYENDKDMDEKYLKIPFMRAVKKNYSIVNVYK